MVFDRTLCFLPDDSVIGEKSIRCKGDVIVGDRARLSRGIISEGRLFVGEFADLKGDLVAVGDIRIDKGTKVLGDITGDNNIYLGERSSVKGEVVVGRDLDIGERVDIDPKTIESRGLINIRNPISVIIYILLYLLELIKRDDSTEIDRFFKEMETGEGGDFLISNNFTYLPRGTRLDGEMFEVPGGLRIGPRARVVANVVSQGDVDLETEAVLIGDLNAKGKVYIGENVIINGNVLSDIEITVHHAARIDGNLRSKNISITPDTIVEGTLKGSEGIRILMEGEGAVEERISRYEKGVDSLEGVIGTEQQ